MKDEEQHPPLENLEDLDLRFINFEELPPPSEASSPMGSASRVFILIFGISLIGLLMWFPTSDLYLASAHDNTTFFGVSGVAILLGLLGGRWLWAWIEEAATRYAEQAPPSQPREDRIITPFERRATLAGAIAGLITAAVASQEHLGIPGQNTSGRWWVIAFGALLSAGLGGRWILLQATRPPVEGPERPRIELPKWFKWVTFSLLALGGLFAVLGSSLFGQAGNILNTSIFGSIGLIVGTLGAIWISKRFDELEQHFKDSVKEPPSSPEKELLND